MRVFVTGGSGYIGRSLIPALTRHGHQVTALARSDSAASAVTELGATAVRGDLAGTDALRGYAAEADAAIHLGAASSPHEDLASARALLEGLGDSGVYVHTGGVWVYGNTDGVVDEDAPQNPPAITSWRAANEHEVLAAGGRLVMPGLVYGHRGSLTRTFYTDPGRRNGAVPVIGSGTNHWALVHVDDIADLYARALNAAPGAVYAGVADQNVPQLDIARALSEAAGCPGSLEHLTLEAALDQMGPIAEAFALDQQMTGARARRELGWKPTHTDPLGELAKESA